ncbi:MAG: class I SAM-dependent methyltransferase [Rubripirellula sp.]
MTAQDQTLTQYQHLMQINAASHLIRTAREVGLLAELREGQRTLPQICNQLSLVPDSTKLLLDGLVATGIVEKYEDDFALSRAAHLLCQYDEDLGDQMWSTLADQVRGKRTRSDSEALADYVAATQWAHTPAAIQAAEILNVGGEGEVAGARILDLGCGSAVWSCAMAHQDPQSTIVAVDNAAALVAARATAESIGLGERFETIEAESLEVELPQEDFDLAVIAQRVGGLSAQAASSLLDGAVKTLKPGGRIAVIDLFRGPTKPNLSESIEALRLDLGSQAGHIRTLEAIQSQLIDLGLQGVQFAFIAASKANMGIAVGTKP